MLLVIWGNSLLSGEISSAVSDLFGKIVNFFLPEADAAGGGQGHGLLRKLGHLTEFAVLGALVRWHSAMQKRESWRAFLWPLLFGLAAACIDETIQLFVPGRAGRLTDVGIDTLGVALGIVLITLIQTMKMKFLEETKQ